MIYKGNSNNANGVYFGGKAADRVLLGTKTVWEREYSDLEHYGMRWKKSNTVYDPTDPTECEYIYDCEEWNRAHCSNVEGDPFILGTWPNAFFMKNLYPVMCKYDGTEDYKLSKSDQTYKEDNITISDISNINYNGNAMACFNCHIWIKFFEDEEYQGFEVSNYQLDEDFVDWPYIREDGTRASKLYYPMFEGTIIDGKLRSIGTGKASNNTTVQEELTAARANDELDANSVWSIGDWSHHLWFTVLCMLIGKNTAPNKILGFGNADGNEIADNGLCINKGPFYGTASYGPTPLSTPLKTFYCENMWSNRQKRLLGFYSVNGNFYVKNTPLYTIDGTYNNYINCGSTTGDNSGWILSIKKTNCGFVPEVISGNSDNPVHQRFFAFCSNNFEIISMAIAGGNYNSRFMGSLLNLNFANSFSAYGPMIGASLYLTQPK